MKRRVAPRRRGPRGRRARRRPARGARRPARAAAPGRPSRAGRASRPPPRGRPAWNTARVQHLYLTTVRSSTLNIHTILYDTLLRTRVTHTRTIVRSNTKILHSTVDTFLSQLHYILELKLDDALFE